MVLPLSVPTHTRRSQKDRQINTGTGSWVLVANLRARSPLRRDRGEEFHEGTLAQPTDYT
jgi:hypothetical protein